MGSARGGDARLEKAGGPPSFAQRSQLDSVWSSPSRACAFVNGRADSKWQAVGAALLWAPSLQQAPTRRAAGCWLLAPGSRRVRAETVRRAWPTMTTSEFSSQGALRLYHCVLPCSGCVLVTVVFFFCLGVRVPSTVVSLQRVVESPEHGFLRPRWRIALPLWA